MYLEHFGLREPPFRITPQLEYFFSGAQRGAMLDALKFAIGHDEGIVLVTGEVGTGKTMLSRMLIEQLGDDVLLIYIANPTLSPVTLLATLARELGVQDFDALGALRLIEERLIALYGEGRRVLLMIDEAHAMPRESLEQVRLLSNLESPTRKLLQIALFGQPELDTLLATREMRSLRERVTQRFALRPLHHNEIADYLRFRLHAAGYRGPSPFSRSALAIIGCASRGLSRRVNILADKALLAAFADGTHEVKRRQALIAVRDAAYPGTTAALPRWIQALGAAGLVAIVVSAISLLWPRMSAITPPGAAVAATAANSAPPPQSATVPASATPSPSAASAPLTNTQTAESAPVPTAALATTASSPASSAVTGKPSLTARDRITQSRQRIMDTSADRWFIQVLTVRPQELPAVDGFINKAGGALDDASLLVYESEVRQRVGVIYGNYASQDEAARALSALPAWIRGSGAYVRSYKAFK